MIDGVNAMAALVHQMRAIGYWRTTRPPTSSSTPRRSTRSSSVPTASTSRWVRSSRPSMPSCCDAWAGRCRPGAPVPHRGLAGAEGIAWRTPAREDARPLVCAAGRQRRVLRAGARLDEAAAHPHNLARGSMVEVDGRRQPALALRLSRTRRHRAPSRGAVIGEHTDAVLAELGFDAAAIAVLRQTKACA